MSEILMQTSGVISASTPSALIDPMSAASAVLPAGSVVKSIKFYRSDNQTNLTSGLLMQFGLDGAVGKYLPSAKNYTTDDVNSGGMFHITVAEDIALSADSEFRVTFSGDLAAGSLGVTVNTDHY